MEPHANAHVNGQSGDIHVLVIGAGASLHVQFHIHILLSFFPSLNDMACTTTVTVLTSRVQVSQDSWWLRVSKRYKGFLHDLIPLPIHLCEQPLTAD